MDRTTLLVVIALVVVVAIVLITLMQRRQKSEKLKERFGPEYEHAVDEYQGDKERAEEELIARQKRVEKLNIHPLSVEESRRFSDEWRVVQARFVDNPSGAIVDADQLVKQVMETRGYPMGDFEQQAADISVDHAAVVTHYRAARDIVLENRNGKTNTEKLRQAMVHYRALFEDLLAGADQSPERVREAI